MVHKTPKVEELTVEEIIKRMTTVFQLVDLHLTIKLEGSMPNPNSKMQ